MAVGFAGALAHSQRGLTGSISHTFNTLTDPNAKPPPNTPGRLTAIASVRARYWKEALQIFEAHPVLGAGADGYRTARLRYRNETLEVRHAHGFIVQTLADLGIVGLLLALGLLGTWMAAAGRATHMFNRRWGPMGRVASHQIGRAPRLAEQPAALHARADRDAQHAVPGRRVRRALDDRLDLVHAGHRLRRPAVRGLARRARRAQPARRRGRRSRAAHQAPAARRPSDLRLALACATVVAALLAMWTQWQPQHSEEARNQALELLAHNPAAALSEANTAVSRDPLSVEALFALASVEQASGHPALARATLQRAVRLQPSNPQTWLTLGRYDLTSDPAAALPEFQAAVYLNPQSIAPEAIANKEREAIEIYNDYVEAVRASSSSKP